MRYFELKNLLSTHKIFPLKKLGQNFLIDQRILKKIIESSQLTKEDIVLEVGPGIGNLTLALLKKGIKKLVTVEKDKRMVNFLKTILKDYQNVEIIEGDILERMDGIIEGLSGDYKVIANIPYYLTSGLIRKFFEAKKKPKLMVLMVQKEVAQRICAKPPNMNLLAVSVQFFSRPKIVAFVSKKSFWPRPKVNSAILKLEIKTEKPKLKEDLFFKVVKIGFSHPRKQLLNNFAQKLKIDKEKIQNWLLENGIDFKKRAQELFLDEWIKLAENFQERFEKKFNSSKIDSRKI